MDKKCNCCGKTWDHVPNDARPGEFSYWYWECACKSTMCYTYDKAKSKAEMIKHFEDRRKQSTLS